jgi:hypothetical protein
MSGHKHAIRTPNLKACQDRASYHESLRKQAYVIELLRLVDTIRSHSYKYSSLVLVALVMLNANMPIKSNGRSYNSHRSSFSFTHFLGFCELNETASGQNLKLVSKIALTAEASPIAKASLV